MAEAAAGSAAAAAPNNMEMDAQIMAQEEALRKEQSEAAPVGEVMTTADFA